MTPPDVDRCVAELEQHIEVLRELRDDYHLCGPTEYSEALSAAIRALRQGGGWLPIESAPKDAVCIFWVVPKAAEETYLDTDGNPILARIQPYARQCKFGEWGSLMKATHWQPVQDISAPPSPAKEG